MKSQAAAAGGATPLQGGGNPAATRRVTLQGSFLNPASRGSDYLGDVKPDQQVTVTVMLRRAKPLADGVSMGQASFEKEYGASQADVAKIEAFAKAHKLEMKSIDQAANDSGNPDAIRAAIQSTRLVKLTGTAAQMQAAFGVKVASYQKMTADGATINHLSYSGSIQVPSDLRDTVQGVFGLDKHPIAKRGGVIPRNKLQPMALMDLYDPKDLAKTYQFPDNLDGSGQSIGILSFGGSFEQSDIDAYAQREGVPQRTVSVVNVDGAHNAPDPKGADMENTMDLELAHTLAPGAKLTFYSAPSDGDEQSFIDALATAIHDRANHPDIVSISWGGMEDEWSAQGRNGFHSMLADAAAMGVIVVSSSGDWGSGGTMDSKGNLTTDGKNHPVYPSCDPYVLSAGGTSIPRAAGSALGDLSKEKVWNNGSLAIHLHQGGASGGGQSIYYPIPNYQQGLRPQGTTGSKRIFPDLSLPADPYHGGTDILVGGAANIGNGTSQAAPMLAALFARINQGLTQQHLAPLGGSIHSVLYAAAKAHPDAFHDVVLGNNGYGTSGYKAGPGFDAATGWGSPMGQKLYEAISDVEKKAQASGQSQAA